MWEYSILANKTWWYTSGFPICLIISKDLGVPVPQAHVFHDVTETRLSFPWMLLLYAVKQRNIFHFCIDSNICFFTDVLNLGRNFPDGDPFSIVSQVLLIVHRRPAESDYWTWSLNLPSSCFNFDFFIMPNIYWRAVCLLTHVELTFGAHWVALQVKLELFWGFMGQQFQWLAALNAPSTSLPTQIWK